MSCLGRARWVLPLVVLLGGCDVEFTAQEVVLRHDAEQDTLEIMLCYEGLTAGVSPSARYLFDPGEAYDAESKKVPRAEDAVRRILGGEREFMIVDWPAHFPIETWRREWNAALDALEGAEPDPEHALMREGIQVLAGFELVDQALFLDEQGRLCGFQRFRIQKVSRALDLLNRWIRWTILEDDAAEARAGGDPKDEDPAARRSRELRVEAAKAGATFVALTDGRIDLVMPHSDAEWRENLADMLRGLASEKTETSAFSGFASWLAAAVGTAERIELGGDRVHAVLGTGAPIHWSIACADRTYDAALCDALKEHGVAFREGVTKDALLKEWLGD